MRDTQKDGGDFYNGLEEAARDIGCAHTTLSGWIRSGRLHAQWMYGPGRGGGSWRIAKSDLIDAASKTTKFSANARRLETARDRNGEVDGELVIQLLDKINRPDDQRMILREVQRRWG